MKVWYGTIIGLSVLMLTSGCASMTYDPSNPKYENKARLFTKAEARKKFEAGLDQTLFGFGKSAYADREVRTVDYTAAGINIRTRDNKGGGVECFIGNDLKEATQVISGDGINKILICGELWMENEQAAKDFALAVHSLRMLNENAETKSKSTLDAFRKTASLYRAGVKQEFPEEAQRHRAIAEDAFKQKRLHESAEAYEKALELAPWWPEGHYNRGLILGQLEIYPEAVLEMKKYLMLVPASPNARTAQDKIYVWENQK